jgi:hypothetical protein
MNWRLVLLIIFILEGIYYLTNRLLFHRTFREINYWEWIIIIMIVPLTFVYIYSEQGIVK